MNRTRAIIGGSYVALLAVIFGLGWALRKERSRRRLRLSTISETVRREVSEVASRAAEVAAEVNAFVGRTSNEARTAVGRASKAIR